MKKHSRRHHSLNSLFARMLTSTVFWEGKGAQMVAFMQQGNAIMSKVYCETLNDA
jgi:hypothetical protein